MKFLGVTLAVILLGSQARPVQARPVVVELFTSEACSSCPPAEALLRQLKDAGGDILPLSFHVTYWNSAAWTDRYSLQAATDRQSWYVSLLHGDTVYTPEAVVDGTAQMVGSNRAAVTGAIASAKAGGPAVPLLVAGGATLTVIAGPGSATPATLWVFGYDSRHQTQVGGGENGGATLTEVNVVRSMTRLGGWQGSAITYRTPKPAGQHVAAILQGDDGRILGAATD